MSMVAETATLAHGYTMAQVERFARSASYIKAHPNLDSSDAYEAAWFGIVERLYANDEPPKDNNELIRVGTYAIQYVVAQHLSNHGLTKGRNNQPAPNYVKFWVSSPRSSDNDFTDRLIERMALPQILGCLTAEEYQAIASLASHGSLVAAARSLGIERQILGKRIASARQRAMEAWLSPDSPPRKIPRGDPNTCVNGHSKAEYGVTYPSTGDKVWCILCKRTNARRAKHRRKAAQ